MDAVSQGLEKEAVLGWLLREILLESQAPPPVGVERLIHCHVRSGLQGTAARIIEELKHLPENIIRLSTVPPKGIIRVERANFYLILNVFNFKNIIFHLIRVND